MFRFPCLTVRCSLGMPGRCSSEVMIACSENTYNPSPGASKQIDCLRCPVRTSTLGRAGSTSVDECSCAGGFYKAGIDHTEGREQCIERCCSCPVGTDCMAGDIALSHIPLKPGYFRRSNATVDVRRCPDASANCSGMSECLESSSGCRGGELSEGVCMPGLTGAFCRLCIEPLHYYVAASDIDAAHCKSCDTVASSNAAVIMLIVGFAALFISLLAYVVIQKCTSKPSRKKLHAFYKACKHSTTLLTQLKILVGFYQSEHRRVNAISYCPSCSHSHHH